MKKLFILLLTVGLISTHSYSQKKVMNMPIDATFNTNDWFYVINQATTDGRISGSTISAFIATMIGDTMIIFRTAVYDSLVAIRAVAAGGGSFSKSGYYIYPTSNDDSVVIGATDPNGYKFRVVGSGHLSKNFTVGDTIFIGSSQIFTVGNNMYLDDYTSSSPVTLASLIAGGGLFTSAVSGSQTTHYSTSAAANWKLGATGSTTYKLDITGGLHLGGVTYADNPIYFLGSGSVYGGSLRMWADDDTGYFADESGTYTLEELATGGGTGSGTVTTSGSPANTYITYFTDAAEITGTSKFTIAGGVFTITNSSGDGFDVVNGSDHIFTIDADSVYAPYLAGNEENWVWVTKTGAFDTGTTEDASFMLEKSFDLPRLRQHLKDKQLVNEKYEIKWYYTDSLGVIHERYGLSGSTPAQNLQALQAGIEMSFLYTLRLQNLVIILFIVLVGILIGGIAYFQIKTRDFIQTNKEK